MSLTACPSTRVGGSSLSSSRWRRPEYLRARRDFALNATNTVRQTRAKWIDLCADYGARIEIIYLEPPLPQLLHQNRNRPTAVLESILKAGLERLGRTERVSRGAKPFFVPAGRGLVERWSGSPFL